MAKILVIDDDPLMQQTIRRILERDTHEVHTANDGHDGVALLGARRYDLIITDIMMPRQEGIETIRSIREQANGLPILAISGGGSLGCGDVLSAATMLGANDALPKPFNARELIAKVRSLLPANTPAA
ncbi:MAG: response regulator [Alphaproteobacteria bacterium]|nr:response regulator [Alphaproteobacteria bacterium]